ncbi:glycosyltransferase family 4 protein [Candidatus Uhrbacteria bacterium]|nr:glycosyltransferase family 4 protein [Candidatus Uhrbacteria bacterium]
MLIGIEASRANRPHKTGVEWYAYHLIQHLKRLPEAAAHSWLLYGNTPLTHGLEKGPSHWHERRLAWPPKYLWTQLRLSLEMFRRSPDVLFVPAHVLPRIIPKRTVVTIHDIGFHRFPQLYKPRQVAIHEVTTRDIVKRASRILTVSAFSKQELIEGYAADPDKIFVTHLGVDHDRFYPIEQEEARTYLGRWQIEAPFFLYIGRLERKKNVTTLIEAFHQFKSSRSGDETQLVLVGIPGGGYEEIERAIERSGFADSIHILGYATENEKRALLSSATALVHPAWYEGFGITPLEAMACGCPVICSRAGSLPEVEGIENALWFQPGDAEAIARNMDHVIKDTLLGIHLRERGLAWAKQYRWEKTAEETLRLLTEW